MKPGKIEFTILDGTTVLIDHDEVSVTGENKGFFKDLIQKEIDTHSNFTNLLEMIRRRSGLAEDEIIVISEEYDELEPLPEGSVS